MDLILSQRYVRKPWNPWKHFQRTWNFIRIKILTSVVFATTPLQGTHTWRNTNVPISLRKRTSVCNVVNSTQQENRRSNKNFKFFWRKPFSVETPSLGEKSFLGRSHFWGEALFGEKPFSGRSHFWGEAIFGGEAILGRSHFLGRSHSGEKPFTGEKPFSGRSH